MTIATVSTPARHAVKRSIEDAFRSSCPPSQPQMKRMRRDLAGEEMSSTSLSPARPRMAISFLLNEPADSDQPLARNASRPHLLSSCSDLLFFAESRTGPLSTSSPRSSKSYSIEDASSEVSEDARPKTPPPAEMAPETPSPPAATPAAAPAAGPASSNQRPQQQSPFECDLCQKRFRERGNLTKHRNSVHSSSPRPFVCAVAGCGKSFSFRDGLNRHTQTVHDCVRPHACSVEGCGKRFKQRSHALKHVKTCHRG